MSYIFTPGGPDRPSDPPRPAPRSHPLGGSQPSTRTEPPSTRTEPPDPRTEPPAPARTAPPATSRVRRNPRPRRTPRLLAVLLLAAALTGCGDQGDPVSFAPHGARSAAAGGTRLAVMPAGPQAPWRVQRTVAEAGGTRIAVTDFRGPASGFTGKVWVWAPPQYFERANAAKGFPVLITLPGGVGWPTNYWFGADLRLQEDFHAWTAQGRSLPFILVMPVINPDERYHDCSDIPGSERMGTWLTRDVPDLVRRTFRTLRTRDGWGFMGSSSGGFCALKSVLKHPEAFKAAIPSGPDIAPDSPLWHGDAAAMRADDPRALAGGLITRHGPDVYLGFQAGSTETADLAEVRAFIARYGHGPVHTRLEVIGGGGHNARSYTRGMADGTIAWISAHMRGPSA